MQSLSGDLIDQDILAYFTKPTRSINHARIAEIRNETKPKSVAAASQADLEAFLEAWPQIDTATRPQTWPPKQRHS